MRFWWCFVVWLGFCTQALANGRAPNSIYVVPNPFDANVRVLGATFGPLFSSDGGRNYYWVCEQAIVNASSGLQSSNPIGFYTDANQIFLATIAGAFVSNDAGCNWQGIPMLLGQEISSVAVNPNHPQVFYVMAYNPNTYESMAYLTEDGGNQFVANTALPTSILWNSIAWASFGNLLYAVGANLDTYLGPQLAVSNDNGASFSTTMIDGGFATVSNPLIAVSPTNPNLLLLGLLDAASEVESMVLRVELPSNLGSNVLLLPGSIRNMVFAEDGNRVWISSATNIYYSQDAGLSFTSLAKPSNNACVSLAGNLLFGCGNGAGDGFALAESTDNGNTWQNIYNFNNLLPPTPRCDSNSLVNVWCTPQWSTTASLLGANPNGVAIEPAGVTTTATHGCQGCASGSELVGLPLLPLGLTYFRAWRQRRIRSQ